MITLEFDDLPICTDGVWLAGTALIGEVDLEYDAYCRQPVINEIRLAADALGKPDLVLKRHNALPLFWDLSISILEHMAPTIEQRNPYRSSPYEYDRYENEHRLRLHEVI